MTAILSVTRAFGILVGWAMQLTVLVIYGFLAFIPLSSLAIMGGIWS